MLTQKVGEQEYIIESKNSEIKKLNEENKKLKLDNEKLKEKLSNRPVALDSIWEG